MIRCLIVEDEPIARDVLRKYIEDTPGIVLAGECVDAIEALSFLEDNRVELLFLDIQMPKLSGISFLKSNKQPVEVILTTAYSEFALESYELDVIDYLLKPFSFERFLKAVQKAKNALQQNSVENNVISIKANGKLYRINVEDIQYAESKGDYVTLITIENKLTYYGTLKALQEQIGSKSILRVHKSFVVNLDKIDFIEGNNICLNKKSIPIGNAFKELFLNQFNK